MPPTLKPPRLDPQVLAEPIALSDAIDVLTRGDRRMQQHAREILHRQKQLQEIADEEVWCRYLHLEEAINGRLFDLVGRIARWAFEAGRAFERDGGRR